MVDTAPNKPPPKKWAKPKQGTASHAGGTEGSAGRLWRRESALSPPGNCGSHLLQPPDAVTSASGPAESRKFPFIVQCLWQPATLLSFYLCLSFWISAAYTPIRFPCFDFGQQHQASAVSSRHSPYLFCSPAPFTLRPLPRCYR
ncbi:hypothetical protein M441DRAFT_387306 [Trichoderma asperellum CBS 433.97]|uniref:Uncharacterized protein n=1 Tax=Trichoderma asperellum (strain ATCC 204424 / CBS 433.97 / NBRC 101777) TaxID=1042311 RepID=A0A2T3ZBU5_TRIA4|nr:hypothetical protein M441DRAFT_387306 [Trichoderma asperellum CBS 433.97]PTB42278.1 hypothetical protein M441DRAFT_387306 [Trichoderma asperellum CBS 433.97]